MTTDNKTLADVQPGGRVRLGDALPPLPIRQRFTTLHGETYAYSAEQMQDYARAALAAQPSPGGQGDARAQFEAWAESAGWYAVAYRPDRDAPYALNAVEFAWQAFQAALAARQPVGEPITVEAVAEIFNHPEYGLSIDWLLENGIGELQVGDVLMVSDRAITDEDGSGEVYAAPPAQAVDLGAVPDGWRLSKKTTCYQLSHGNEIIGNLVGPDAEENAAIIARVLDSQAVGK